MREEVQEDKAAACRARNGGGEGAGEWAGGQRREGEERRGQGQEIRRERVLHKATRRAARTGSAAGRERERATATASCASPKKAPTSSEADSARNWVNETCVGLGADTAG